MPCPVIPDISYLVCPRKNVASPVALLLCVERYFLVTDVNMCIFWVLQESNSVQTFRLSFIMILRIIIFFYTLNNRMNDLIPCMKPIHFSHFLSCPDCLPTSASWQLFLFPVLSLVNARQINTQGGFPRNSACCDLRVMRLALSISRAWQKALCIVSKSWRNPVKCPTTACAWNSCPPIRMFVTEFLHNYSCICLIG